MEAEPPSRRLRAPNRLSDCTNTISSTTALATIASSQSSFSYTVKLKRQTPKLPSPSVVPPPIPSTHPCPHPVSSSVSGNFCAPFSISPFLALGSGVISALFWF
ncbi:endochitinase A-like [Pyrus ussuriensis x Pyrus communis]|uniref:Endochitinase A-like n=1 Tax=Pyrus ussuriensis x Pyrus communis TaxID=2448454 RepID=A0A5N5G3P9_9ROSA|nr:endochitinase A-like [Pyrus ussuriensis x Pyrus communis]